MGHRLSKVYTRSGDNGTTGLSAGERLAKDDPRVCAIGDVDELNSHIGLLLTEALDDALRTALTGIQQRLFDLGGELALPDFTAIQQDHIAALETLIDDHNGTLPALREFVLPGGSRAAACCHVARAVCRRAERSLVTVARTQPLRPEVLSYLNRLSDLLFVLARVLNREAGGPELQWQPQGKPGS